ncbi:MAG: glutamyl-tRNA reductase, partial [Chloroflexi bacterium]|nr:glutamyl-tRNA reductase [Chloroflexota bacterium]
MHILLVGLSHNSAPLAVRERVSFSHNQLEEALPALRKRAGDSIIVSTCNRTEIYTTTPNPTKTTGTVLDFLAGYHKLDPDTLAPHLYTEQDTDAARHLFQVAAGLDSFILGESEILGQVRNALSASSDAHRVQVPLSRLFHGAIRSGRRVRDETDISRNALSVSFAGVRLVQRELGDLARLHVLLVGAGEAGRLVAKALRTAGVGRLTVTNRTHERAVELANELAAEAVPFEDMPRYLDTADVVITATEVSNLMSVSDITEAMHRRADKPLFVMDLGVPRNVEPQAADVENVRLYNIYDLSAIAEENLQLRKAAAGDAEAIVEEELAKFTLWWESQEAVSAVKELQKRADDIRLKELER